MGVRVFLLFLGYGCFAINTQDMWRQPLPHCMWHAYRHLRTQLSRQMFLCKPEPLSPKAAGSSTRAAPSSSAALQTHPAPHPAHSPWPWESPIATANTRYSLQDPVQMSPGQSFSSLVTSQGCDSCPLSLATPRGQLSLRGKGAAQGHCSQTPRAWMPTCQLRGGDMVLCGPGMLTDLSVMFVKST